MAIVILLLLGIGFLAVCLGGGFAWQRWEDNTEGMTPEQAAARKRKSQNIQIGVAAAGVAMNVAANRMAHSNQQAQAHAEAQRQADYQYKYAAWERANRYHPGSSHPPRY